VVLSWTAPSDFTPNGYDISVNGVLVAGTVVGTTPTTTATTYTFTGTPGTLYTFTVTPDYSSPYAGTPATIQGTPNAAQVLIQDITVVRPVGALVLTQRCGVYGALPTETVPGFGTIGGVVASADQTGIAPTTPNQGSAGDPNFPTYPYPVDANGVPNPNYPTHCGVDMGIGKLITSGPLAGQYFTATGRLNEVTVVDTRDQDTQWTVTGSVSAFTTTGSSFSGDYLGWTPVVTSDSGTTMAGYNQVVAPGAAVNPNFVPGTPGGALATSKTLASALAGQGLGIATLDARLKLFIPLTAKNGTYTAILTFTAI
jgi:hypothetical protein